MKIICGVVLIWAVSVDSQSAQQRCFGGSDEFNRDSHKSLYSGQQDFSLALLSAINRLMPNDNLFFSPFSTYHALLTAFFLSANQTENFLRSTLRLDQSQTKNDIFGAYKLDRFMTNLSAVNAAYEFTSANKIYVSDGIAVRDCILDLFPYELNVTNFKQNPELARTNINHWVEERTHDMIKDLLPPGTIDQTTDLVLVNAAYFKGMWENKFNPSETKQEVFYVNPSKQIMVDMMHTEGTFNFEASETLGAHVLEMPYEGGAISMYIILPPFAKPDALQNTLKKLDIKEFQNIVNGKNSYGHTVSVSLPKFSLEHTIELVPILEKLGVGDLFSETSDLSILSDDKIHLNAALHKARIQVNEEGSEAAAASVLFSFRSSRPAEPVQFNCNHPFVYVIFDKIQSAVLFTGVFRRPY